MKVEINLKIFIALLLFILLDNVNTYIIFLVSIIIHELAHLIVGIILGGTPKKMTISIFGVALEFYSYGKNTSICKIIFFLIGPLINFLIATIMTSVAIDTKLAELIIVINIAIGIFNLIPILPLDGGKILKEILKNIIGAERANKIMIHFSKFLLILASLSYSVLILKIKNIAILFILLYLWYLYYIEEKKYNLYEKTKECIRNII